jgi:hypothetical protein
MAARIVFLLFPAWLAANFIFVSPSFVVFHSGKKHGGNQGEAKGPKRPGRLCI